MGVGYEYVDQALNGGLLLDSMVILCFLKLAATIVSYASGNAGGIFAPSLYIGAMAGGAVGMVINRIAPFPTATPGAYALVGMGTLFAGIIRAPMTSVFMIFEITQDYQILVPLMVANLLSFVISRRYQPVPIYHALLHQDGVHLPSPTSHGLRKMRTARQIMSTDVSFLSPDMSVRDAWARSGEQDGSVYLVGTPDHLIGTVTREQLEQWNATHNDELVARLVPDSFVHAHADHPIDVVIERLEESGGLLPIVSRAEVHKLEGVVTPETIVRVRRRARQRTISARGHDDP
jgi:CIC family chloride channel protein